MPLPIYHQIGWPLLRLSIGFGGILVSISQNVPLISQAISEKGNYDITSRIWNLTSCTLGPMPHTPLSSNSDAPPVQCLLDTSETDVANLADPWAGPVGGWVPLSGLLAAVEAQLKVPQSVAAGVLRQAMVSGRIEAEVAGWQGMNMYRSADKRGWAAAERGAFGADADRAYVSQDGWRHVDLRAGILDGCKVLVRWLDVQCALASAPLAPSAPPTTSNTGAAMTWMRGYALGCNQSGRKPKRDATLRLCQTDVGASYREARAAWDALPAERKNPPRKVGE